MAESRKFEKNVVYFHLRVSLLSVDVVINSSCFGSSWVWDFCCRARFDELFNNLLMALDRWGVAKISWLSFTMYGLVILSAEENLVDVLLLIPAIRFIFGENYVRSKLSGFPKVDL